MRLDIVIKMKLIFIPLPFKSVMGLGGHLIWHVSGRSPIAPTASPSDHLAASAMAEVDQKEYAATCANSLTD